VLLGRKSDILRRTKIYKERKFFIEQFIDFLENNEDYKAYTENNDRYKAFTECNSQLTLWSIKFFDTYNNKGINKLVKEISKLSKDKYDVDLALRPKKFKDLNYLDLQYDHTSSTFLAKLKLFNDKFIREISASFAQINNNQIVVEYDINFNKIMNDQMLFDFVKKNKGILYRKNFVSYYNFSQITDHNDFDNIYHVFEELVESTFQAKLFEVFELNFGKRYKLPSCLITNYPEGLFTKEYLRDVFLCETYEINDGEQYLIIDKTSQEGLKMELCFSGKFYQPFSFTTFISRYRMNLYYLLFDKIESYLLNQKMNKYFSESKNSISSRDYKWLVNKIRAINDNKLLMNYERNYKKEPEKWKVFYNGKETENSLSNNSYVIKYETIYNDCLEHIKIIYGLQKENLIIYIASFTLLASLIGIFATIFVK